MEPSATAIESELKGLQGLPTPVASWEVETGLDATDDPSVWVWAMLEEEDVDSGTRARPAGHHRQSGKRGLAHDPPWVYVRFRGASESI